MGHEFKQTSPRAHQHDPLEVLAWVKALRISLNDTPQLAQLPERSLILRLEQRQNVHKGMYVCYVNVVALQLTRLMDESGKSRRVC